jgi:RHS repeat-associated protein
MKTTPHLLLLFLLAPVAFIANSQPNAPTNLVATTATTAQVNLRWTDASANETGFQVERSLTAGTGFALIATTGATVVAYSNTGLTDGTMYFYRVRSINATGGSAYATEASAATLLAVPTAPAASAVSTTQVNLSWNDVSASEAGYQVERSLTAGTGFALLATTAANAVSYTDTGLASGTRYFYRLRSTNANGSSAYSTEVNATARLDAPTALASATASPTQINLTWADASANETGFQIERSLTTGTGFAVIATAAANAVSFNNAGLAAGTKYFYRVRSINATGTSAYTDETSATTNLVAPTSLLLTAASTTQINLTWADGAANETGFQVERSLTTGTGFALVASTAANATSHQDTGLAGGTTYFYRVRAVNADGISLYTPQASIATIALGAPLPPTALTASGVSPSQINLTWTDGSTDETGFQIERSATAGTGFGLLTTAPANTTSYASTGLAGGTRYFYRVRAVNASGGSAYTPESNAVTNVVAPTTFTATAASTAQVTLTWWDMSGNETGFQIERSLTAGSGHALVATTAANTTRFTDAGLAANTQYHYRVRAVNAISSSAYAPEAGARTMTQPEEDFSNLAFQYRYDGRRRMTHKKVPGADWVYMVYDDRDRLVMTQDGNQRMANQWAYTKYDALNRPIMTGIYTHNAPLDQAAMSGRISKTVFSETYNGAAATHGYTNTVFAAPNFTVANFAPLTVTYYDNYGFRDLWGAPFAYVDEDLSGTVHGSAYSQPDRENTHVTGQVTGTKVKVLDGGPAGGFTWLRSVTYYDDKYRAVQVIADNYKGGTDRTTHVVDFVGKVLKTKATHTESDITWTGMANTLVQGNKLIGAANNTWAAGAASVQQLPAGQDGWLEVTASEATTHRMVGLSPSSPDAGYTSLAHAWYMATGALHIYEGGVSRGAFGAYAAGDVLKIERSASTVRYYQNGALKYTSPVVSTSMLLVDASFYTTGGTLVGVRTSFGGSSTSIVRRFDYDHAGRLLRAWHQVEPQAEVLLSQNEYNELGQLVDKKLHSADNGSTFKQSVDYRYNIRGWLTSMNDASLTSTGPTNDDTGDLFGMNLLYNTTESGLSNTPLHNGNISAIAWSHHQGLGTVKQNGHVYGYDPMNRLQGSIFKEKSSAWSAPANSALAETGFEYDLNGNIKKLQRNDRRASGLMDDLAYDYGAGGNQLKWVKDHGDANAGFIDGNPALAPDYTYDANGNMTRDLNKGIGTSLADGANTIAYNHLNLPETVTKGGNHVRYIYDAGGRKLAQVSTYGTAQKQTDYSGEFQYENGVLRSIAHEEGRVTLQKTTQVYTNDGAGLNGVVATTGTGGLATLVVQNGQTYIKVECTGSGQRSGAFFNGTMGVQPGERYLLRAKGHYSGTVPVAFQVRANSTDIGPVATLPASPVMESWVEQVVAMPAGASTLTVGLVWGLVATGQQFFLNDFEIVKLETMAPEYQYHLKDHLGNVRLTFTSKDETEAPTATLETANATTESGQFLRYANARRIQSSLFDRTNGSAPSTVTGYAQRLSGGANEKYGLARSISVMPGDVINVEVYAKYVDPATTPASGTELANLLAYLAGAVAPAGTIIDGAGYGSSTTSFPSNYGGLLTKTNNGAPKAYLNWLVFDRDYNFLAAKSGFKQVTTVGKEAGTDVDHERVFSPTIHIAEAGYVYVYLSNENETPVECYFDDFKVTHVKSPVVESNDYYPFGLISQSFARENSLRQDYKYNGKELQDELSLGWLDYGARMYQPDLGRWMVVDPLGEKYPALNPYNYVGNNPLNLTDPDGRDIDVTFSGTDKQKADARRLLTGLLNRALGGQFEITLTATKGNKNVFKMGITDASSLGKDKDGKQIKGDVSKLGESGKVAYSKLNGMINDHSRTSKIDLSVRNTDVTTGFFGEQQKIDMADVTAWPAFDPHADSQETGATDMGKFMHETAENFYGNKGKSYHHGHEIAIKQYEDAINGSTRSDKMFVPRRGVVTQTFNLKNGTAVQYKISQGANGVIIVTPVPQKK